MKNNSTLKWLWKITGFKKIYIAVLIFIQAVLGINSAIYAVLLKNIIDSAMAESFSDFKLYVLEIILLVAFNLILRAFVRFLEEYSRSTFENILKERLFSCLLKKNYASVTSIHSGEWINRLTNDTVVTSNAIVEIFPGIVGMTVKLFAALIMILKLEPRFAYILFPCGALLIFFTYAFRKKLKRLHKKIQEKDGNLRTFLQERLGSLIIVRTFSAEKQTEKDSLEKMQEHKNARMKRNHFSNFCNIGFGMAINGMYILGIIYCGYGILIGTVSYGTLMAVAQLIAQIQSPFANITGYLPKFYAMTASAERLMESENFEDYHKKNIIEKSRIQSFYKNDFKGISFENVDFTYTPPVRNNNSKKNMPVVLKNINIEIKKGEYIAFTGHSGCGKSTFLKLLMCLYPVDSGEKFLLTNNGKIRLTSEWCRLFAYVPQGNQLMSGTIREIIAFSDKSRAFFDKDIKNALKISCADEFIDNLENGVDTFLGERGTGLSEGQMQRIAIARAVFSENPILLLDEATSALDEKTEKKVLSNLKNLTDKTVIIVTHRPAALDICNKIVRFSDDGVWGEIMQKLSN